MRQRRNFVLTARNADKFYLYINSVQSPFHDARFLASCFRRITGRSARIFREDFCGTANLSCEFIKLHRENYACGVDMDPLPLQWSVLCNVPLLTESQVKRLKLIKADVRVAQLAGMDMIAALNLSYWILKEREDLLAYFDKVRKDLLPGGLLILDAIGGVINQTVSSAEYNRGSFSYIWEVARFNPIDHHILCKIHFKFKDESQIRNAFVYDWRMWTLPELRDLLLQAQFRRVHVLWEGTDRKTHKGNAVFRKALRVKQEDAWGAYVVAVA